jgi:hypothetical protein
MVAPEIRVDGLPELRSALRKVEAGLPKELSEVGKEVGRFVAEKARSRAYGLGSVAAKSAPSLRAAAAAGGGAVRLGGGGGYELGAEFGGQRRPTTMQFQPWRGSGSGAGYFLYPSIRDNADQIEQQWTEGVEGLLKRAGLA